jgi:hypothetical protein
MMKSQCLSFLAILFSVASCAPINYEATYRPPSGHVSAYKSSQTYYRPIQVTLYSDSTYLGVNFNPIQIVISDGQYVEIPAKNRRGRSSRIFAHYHHGNLHFDGNRKCQKIVGSTGYQYDSRWDKGYNYVFVNGGLDYDFTGLRLVIRNIPKGSNRPSHALTTKVRKILKKTRNTDKYRSVISGNKRLKEKKVVVQKRSKSFTRKVGVAKKTSKHTKQPSINKYVEIKEKVRVTNASKPKKSIAPVITREIAKHGKAQKIRVTEQRSSREALNKSARKRSVVAQGNNEVHGIKFRQAKLKVKPVYVASKVNVEIKDEGLRSRAAASKKTKEVQSSKKKAERTPSQKKSIDRGIDQPGVSEVIAIAHPKGRDNHNQVKKDR